MTEDDIYRTSTQYRLWSFTPELIFAQRTRTNALAAEGVRAAIRTAHANATAQAEDSEVDCLSVGEELKLVGYYCIQAIKLADFCDFPTNVKVTFIMALW